MPSVTLAPDVGNGTVYKTVVVPGNVNTALMWSTARNAPSGTVAVDSRRSNSRDVAGSSWVFDAEYQESYWSFRRAFFPFIYPAIQGTITSAALGITARFATNGQFRVVTSTQADISQLVVGDYSRVGSTPIGSFGNVPANTPVSIALDPTAIGVTETKLAVRGLNDLDNNAQQEDAVLFAYLSSYPIVAHRPKLTVTYTEGGGGGGITHPVIGSGIINSRAIVRGASW